MKNFLVLIIVCMTSFSSHLFAKEDVFEINTIQNQFSSGCMNYYQVTQIDCEGNASTVNLGGNRGDCGGSADGDILFHNTTVSSCNGAAIASSTMSLLSIAATIAMVCP